MRRSPIGVSQIIFGIIGKVQFFSFSNSSIFTNFSILSIFILLNCFNPFSSVSVYPAWGYTGDIRCIKIFIVEGKCDSGEPLRLWSPLHLHPSRPAPRHRTPLEARASFSPESCRRTHHCADPSLKKNVGSKTEIREVRVRVRGES